MSRKQRNNMCLNDQERDGNEDSNRMSVTMSLHEFAVFTEAQERGDTAEFLTKIRSNINAGRGTGNALAALQLKDGKRAGFHLIAKSGLERFAVYVSENTLDRWQFLEANKVNATITGYSKKGWQICRAIWTKDGVEGEVPAKSATEDLPPGKLLEMTALGFEMEDVAGSLFVWCPMARKLLFSNHRLVAKWIRSVWIENPQIGIGSDCIIVPKGQNLNFHFIDEEVPMAVYQMSMDEARDIGILTFIYVRSFDRSEVQICLPDER